MKKKKKERKERFLQENYSLTWKYIKESKNSILFVILIFALGFSIASYYQPPEIVELIMEIIEKLLEETAGLNLWQMIIYILNNNLRSSFFAMVLGVFLGIFPVFTALFNGYILGFVTEKSVQVGGLSVLWRLAPHGIFEFPAIILALALGARLGFFWTAVKKKKEFLKRIDGSLRVFLFVILPLLIIAAIIEGVLIAVVG